ncbi:unnamed protein product, partial [marine sediment metagenome]
VSIMIKIFLKHWIYEVCINTFFSGIISNFKKFSLSGFHAKVGDYFRYIELNGYAHPKAVITSVVLEHMSIEVWDELESIGAAGEIEEAMGGRPDRFTVYEAKVTFKNGDTDIIAFTQYDITGYAK